MEIKILVKRKPGSEDLPLPRYMSPGASGLDLYAAVEKEVVLRQGTVALIPTGIYLSIPKGFEGQIRPRSGLALKHGITVVNSPGTIDSDYRGEVGVILANLTDQPFPVRRGMRVAQLVFQAIERAVLIPVEELDDTSRSQGGFGHTGRD